jgi:hypothetical protein
MSGVRRNPVEWPQNEGSPVIEEPLRKNARGAARTTGSAKSALPPNEGRAEQSVAERSVRKSAGRVAAAKPSANGDGYAADVVMSVSELELTISRDAENRKRRLTQAEALREHGLHEIKVAAVYAGLVKKLSRDKNDGAVGVAAAKLSFDILKEVTHWHEPQKTVISGDSSELPPFVRLIHNVPRPVRTE